MYLPPECKDRLCEQWAAEIRVTNMLQGWSTADLMQYRAADSQTRAIIRAIIDSRLTIPIAPKQTPPRFESQALYLPGFEPTLIIPATAAATRP